PPGPARRHRPRAPAAYALAAVPRPAVADVPNDLLHGVGQLQRLLVVQREGQATLVELQGDQMVRGLLVGADILGALDLLERVLVPVLAPPLDHASPLWTESLSRWMIPPPRPPRAGRCPGPRPPCMRSAALLTERTQVAARRERIQLRGFQDLRQRHRLVGDVRALGHAGAKHQRRDAARPEEASIARLLIAHGR